MKVPLTSCSAVAEVLMKSKLLRSADGYTNVFIAPDRSKEERRLRKELVNELKSKRNSDPDRKYVISRGQVVCLTNVT